MEITAVEGLPEVSPDDDIATLLTSHASIDDETVVVVSSTIVSKAEGRGVDLDAYTPTPRATELAADLGEEMTPTFVQAVLAESTELLLEQPFLLAVTPFGHVAPNAGIDRSNVPDHDLLLLPTAPMQSARRIRSQLPADPAVLVTDTCGRPFRRGQRGVTIGYAGISAHRDWRGKSDRTGRELSVTVEAIVDELAAAANMQLGEGAGGTPVALIEEFSFGSYDGSDQLFRDRETDYVRQALADWTDDG